MPKEAKDALPICSKENVKKVTKRKAVAIDVQCKQYTMIFASDFNQPKKAVPRARSTRSKSKTAERSLADAKKTTEKQENSTPSSYSNGNASVSDGGGIKLSRKKTEVLGTLNKIDPGQSSSTQSSKSNNDTIKREKRKRFVGEDNDIAAENIPLEAVFPTLQFGINKDICPKKRRRLQSLISPKSPNKFFPLI